MNVTFLFSERHRTFHVLGQREGTRDFNLQAPHNCLTCIETLFSSIRLCNNITETACPEQH